VDLACDTHGEAMISGEMFGGLAAPTVAGVRLYSLKWASEWVYKL